MHVRSLKPHTLILSIAIFIISLVSLFASTVTNAAPNAQINYQGKLTNSSNIAVADGTYNMRFWLLTTPTIATTSAVWTESLTTTNRVQVTNGLFSVMLGSTSPLTSVDFNQTLYLGVEIGSTTTTPVWDGEMSPRKILGTVPAAFEADRLDGLTSSQFVRTDAPSTIASSSPLTLLTITQNGTGDIFNIFDGASEVFTVIDGGFVGVGTTTPSRLFTVNGDMYAANITATGTIATANLTATNATITNATSTTFRTGTLGVGSDYITDITGSGLSLTNGTLSALGDGVSHWLYNGSRLSPSTTVGVGIFASSTIGGGTGATGLTIAGTATTTNLKVTSLTASRALFTGADNLLTTTGVSQYLIDSLSDETGTGSLVFSASPTFTGGATFAGIRVTASSTLAYASSTALTVSGQTYLGYASSTGVSGTNANFTNGYFTFASTTNASTTGLTAQRAYLTTLTILGQTAGVLTTSSSGVVAASTTIGDGYVTDALTLSGGTISSNSISGTLTTTGALTIGDGGDALTIDSSGWDVANSIMTGLSGLVVTGSSTLGYASSTALTVSGNTVLANATSTHLFATNASTSNFYGAGLTSCTGSSNKVTWSNGRFICDTDQAGSGADGVSNWILTTATDALRPSTTKGIVVSASSTIGGGTGATGLTISGGATTTGNAYFGGTMGIGTTTPSATLALTGSGQTNLFQFASSTGSSVLTLDTRGRLNFGTSTTDANIFINGGPTSTQTTRALRNIAIGNMAFSYASTTSGVGGTDNIALGYQALYGSSTIPISGNYNFAAGYQALKNNTSGTSNIGIGYGSLTANTSGGNNIALGVSALTANRTGADNIAVGQTALRYNTTGSNNTALGNSALYENTTGIENVGVGTFALSGVSGSSASYNTALGSRALASIFSGSSSVAVGWKALTNTYDGASSTALGAQAGATNVSGNSNLFLGDDTDSIGTALNYAAAIGSHAKVARSNTLVLGGSGAYTTDIVTGTSTPWAKFSIQNNYGSTTPLFDIATTTSSTYATSSLFRVGHDGFVGIGTSTPSALLALTGKTNQTSPMLRISSSTEAVLFEVAWDGSVNIDGGGFSYNAGTNETSIEQLLLGAVNFETDAGVVSWVDMQSSSTLAGEPLSYSAQIDGNNILTVFGQSNGSGGVQNLRVGIGTTSPWKTLSVSGDLSLTGAIFDTASTSGTNGMVLQTTGTSTRWVATSTLGFSSGSGADGVSNWRQAVAGVLSPSTTVGISVSASSTIGGGTGASGLTINGTATTTNLKVTSLTASRALFTGADNLLTTTGVSQYLIDSLSDETGTGSLVFSTNPLLAGFRSNASSTIGDGTGAGGLTINGGATTTGNAYFGGTVGIGTTTPSATLALTGSGQTNLFQFASSTGSSLLTLDARGRLNFGTSTTDANVFINGGPTSTIAAALRNIAIGNLAFSYASTTSAATDNIALGYQALYGSSTIPMTGDYNIALGTQALTRNISGLRNIAIGYRALDTSTTSSDNVAIGESAMGNNGERVVGSKNTAVGAGGVLMPSAHNGTTQNSAFGYGAVYLNQGSFNSAFGANTLGLAGTGNKGSYNAAFGNDALTNNTGGSYNIAMGYQALANNSTASSSVAIGWNALYNNTSGASSTALGAFAGYRNQTGNSNLFLGDDTDSIGTALNYAAAIGSHAKVARSNTLVLGGSGAYTTDIVTGTSTPWAKFSIQNNYGSTTPLFDIATTTSSTYATSSVFRVNYDGKVGIGTDAPSTLLTVAGTASTTGLVVSNSIELFGGGAKTTANALCLQLTGSVDLCDGSDGGGGAGELSDWQQTIAGVLSPSTTVGISVSASSTIGGGTGASGLTILGNATTTGSLIVQGTATSTFANDIMLTNGCFRDASGKCIGNGRDGTYIVAAYNSTNRAYADYVADGTGDETEINAAITAAYANGRGGKVYLLEGDFTMSTGQGDKIIMATSTALIGAGMGTRLHVANATDANLNVIVASSTPHITIADLFIDGNRYNNTATIQYGVYFSNVSSSTIENVTASGTRRHGIQIDGGSGLRIVNNAVINNGSRGISTNAVSSSLFANNILSSNTANGIVVSGGNYNTLTGNIANRNGDIGMYIFGTNHNTISGNQASLNTNHGINLEGSDDNTVSGNTTNGNSRGLFITSASDRNTITGNTSNSNSAYGVLLSSTAVLNTVTGNSLYGNFTGIEVGSASFRNVISSNVVDTSGTHGIYLNTVDDNTVTGNIVRSSSNHGIYLTSSDNNIIDSNRVSFSGSTYNQIYLENGSNGNLVSSNLINDTSGTGFAIMTSSNSSNNSLVGNVYSGQGASAINDTATGTTKYTQNDRLTVTMNNQVAWSPLYIAASTTGSSTIHVVQSGTGPLMSFFTATSGELFTIENNGFVGIGTSTPTALLALTGRANQTSPMLRISSSTEAVLFEVAWDGSVNIDGGGFSYNAGTNETTIEQLMLGAVNFETDAGVVSWVDMQSSSTPSGDTLSYSAQIDGNPVLTVFGQSNGSGGVQNLRVGIGTTSPWKTLSVSGDISLTGAIFDTASTSGTNGQYLMSTGTSTRWSTVTASGDGVSDWRQAIAGVLSPSTTVGISVSASSTIGGGTGATGLTINGTATTTGLVVSNSIELFGGGVKTTANELCLQLTGSAALCDGSDDGGGGSGELSDWQLGGVGYITPSTTVGIIVSASSTIGGGTGASGLTISGGATTTGNAYFAGSVAIGTTTPSATLALTGSGQTNLFQFASSTGSSLLTLDARGSLNFGTSTTDANVFINGGPTSTIAAAFRNIAIGNFAFSYASTTSAANDNIALGYRALYGSSSVPMTGDRNVAIGSDNLSGLTSGSNNTAIGGYAMGRISGTARDNVAIGFSALSANTSGLTVGNYNTVVGSNAMYMFASSAATRNNAFGNNALYRNIGSYNNAFGSSALSGGDTNNQEGSYNNAFGEYALYTNRYGSMNAAFGTNALYSNVSGSSSVAVGFNALYSNTTGASSTALGAFAGYRNTTGRSNLYLGDEADSIGTALNYAAAIGSHAKVARSNTLVLGGTGAYTTDIVTGTSTPWAKLSIQNNYGSTTPLFDIATTTSSTYATSSLFRVGHDGRVSIGSTTPESQSLTIQKTGITGSVIAGIKEYLGFTNSTQSAIYYGDNTYIVNAPTATSTLVGKIIRIEDNSQFGNTVRGLEVQAHRGTTTKGENTAISGFGRTFGVRGTTEGDAGDTFIPAGVYAESRGTTQGNALRAYSGSITTSNLAYLFQDTSVFSGTGLLMNFGNAGGSFAATSTGKFLDFQNGGTSKFTVTAAGTTTIGDGTTGNMAGLQIGFGGLCVDNDGSCAASTTGRITAVQYGTANSDLAEMYFSNEDLLPGEIVALDGGLSITRAEHEDPNLIVGVVSTKPGITMGFDDKPMNIGEEAYPVALKGRVPVRLSTENGPIAKGDRITISSIEGVGMKAKESSVVVGIALEDYDGEHAYTEGFINQFGDDIAKAKTRPINQNMDTRTQDGCSYGAGNEEGEATCVKDIVKAIKVKTVTPPSYEEALQELEDEEATTTILENGEEVQVGQALMFVQLAQYTMDAEVDILALLNSTSTLENGDGEETLFDRLKELAEGFVDGVLTLAEVVADKFTAEEVQTEMLCIGDTCVDESTLRALLRSQGQSSAENPIEPTPEPEPELTDDGEETPPNDDAEDTTPPEDGGVGGGSDETDPSTEPTEEGGDEEGDTDPEPVLDEEVPTVPEPELPTE